MQQLMAAMSRKNDLIIKVMDTEEMMCVLCSQILKFEPEAVFLTRLEGILGDWFGGNFRRLRDFRREAGGF